MLLVEVGEDFDLVIGFTLAERIVGLVASRSFLLPAEAFALDFGRVVAPCKLRITAVFKHLWIDFGAAA